MGMRSVGFHQSFGQISLRNVPLIVGTTVASALAIISLARLALFPTLKKITPSPRETLLPRLTEEEQQRLPYPPDAFPGARDVSSPYGTMRVYEFGPNDGRKVLLIHGITTPSVALGGIAHGLAEKGCRVMLMDLFGRGYSDGVDLPHDSRLYTTQILLAITSSPLAWTPEGFSIIGYSLGAGVSADFAAAFPKLINGVVLLAPGGLLRPHHLSWKSFLLYSSWMPEIIGQKLVERQLRKSAATVEESSEARKSDAERVVSAEIAGTQDSPILCRQRPGVTVAGAVQWQERYHRGFAKSFVSSLRNASITAPGNVWAKLGGREYKILIFAGQTDEIILLVELKEDADKVIGASSIEWRVIEGGHEFPVIKSADVVREISEVWGL